MNFEYYIARRIHFAQGGRGVSRPAVRIATAGMALGLAVMLVAVAVITGFKREIRDKAAGFGGHVQVSNFDNNNTYEARPIRMDTATQRRVENVPGVRHVQRVATKPGIIKTADEFQGIVLKGVGADFDWAFFADNLTAGHTLDTHSDTLRNEVVISEWLARRLGLDVGDTFFTYFIQENVRARRFTIAGLYSTDFTEYDRLFVLADIRHVRRLNDWDTDQFSTLEVLLDDFDRMDEAGEGVYLATANHFNDEGDAYLTRTIRQLNPQIFGWLDLLDMNVWVILALITAVAGFIMISGLLILILERTQLIGTLKALGATDWTVRRIFLYHAMMLVARGMLWGNVIGLGLCALQAWTGIVPLDPESYYTATVPVAFHWGYIVLLNAGALAASLLMMLGPSVLASRISPAAIMRYE